MIALPTLSTMKSEDKDALIYDLWERNKALEAELEKYLRSCTILIKGCVEVKNLKKRA